VESPSDEQLLKDFAAGDTASFELLVRRHARELFQFAVRLTGNSAAAEDVAQETFVRMYQAAKTFDTARRFKPWLFTIAANKGRDYLRRRENKREVSLEAFVNEDDSHGHRFLDLFTETDSSDSSDANLKREEKRRVVRRIIEEMSPKLKEILILGYYHRFSYKEIGEILGIEVGTVKSRLHHAVVQFGKRYAVAVQNQLEKGG